MSTADNDHVEYDRDLMRSCIYGLAIGDALGVPYGSRGRGTFECTGMAGGGTHGHIASRPIEAVESDGYREHTLEAALWCLLNTGSYADCVLKAVDLGGDTDATAAVAGAPAGAYYRFEAIPPKRIDRLRGKAVMDRCI